MPEKWTGKLIGDMHNYGVTFDDLAAECGVTKSYISMILNGKRKPRDAQARLEAALSAIKGRRKNH